MWSLRHCLAVPPPRYIGLSTTCYFEERSEYSHRLAEARAPHRADLGSQQGSLVIGSFRFYPQLDLDCRDPAGW